MSRAVENPLNGWSRGAAAKVAVIVSVLIGLLVPALAPSRPGDLDRGFGADGIVTTQIDSGICRCHDQESVGEMFALGRTGLLAVGSSNGDLALAQYDQQGRLDPAFGGGDGLATAHLGEPDNEALYAVGAALQEDGKIVIVTQDFVARFNPDGSLDESFGGGGIVDIFLSHGLSDLVIQPDGKIVVVGNAGGGRHGPFFVRLLPDGSRDRSFGNRGQVAVGPSQGFTSAQALALQDDGKIVMVGVGFLKGRQQFYLVRLTSNGRPDPNFGRRGGRDGIVQTAIGKASFAMDVVLQRDGRIVVAGDTLSALKPQKYIIARYLENGRLDPRFGRGDGIVTTRTRDAQLGGVALQGGRILLAGYGTRRLGNRVINGFALMRYRPTGVLDSRFGQDGIVLTSIGSSAGATALAAQWPGKVFVGGWASFGGEFRFAVARYRSHA